jgi:hypothetical protein
MVKEDRKVTSRLIADNTRHYENSGSTYFKRRFEETKTVLNAPAHSVAIIPQFLTQKQVATLSHPTYSPDLSLPEYFLFSKVKLKLKGARLCN